jgi:hypothetical protein
MTRGINPETGLEVLPGPGVEALCADCDAYLVSGPLGWEHYKAPPCDLPPVEHDGRGLCCSCELWLDGACRHRNPLAAEWWAEWGVPGLGFAAWRRGAPGCPVWQQYRPISRNHDQRPSPSQWRG